MMKSDIQRSRQRTNTSNFINQGLDQPAVNIGPRIEEARKRRGAMLIFVGILMIVLLFAVALSIDVAYMHLVNSELRVATDAAAKAAAQQLSEEVRSQALATSGATLNRANVINRAKQVAESNLVAGQALRLRNSDVEIGRSTRVGSGRFQFLVNGSPPIAYVWSGDGPTIHCPKCWAILRTIFWGNELSTSTTRNGFVHPARYRLD